MNPSARPARTPRSRPPKTAALRPAPNLRLDQLRDQLAGTVDALQRRRADLVPESLIADYVALDWLEWNGGTLRVTLTGMNICRQTATGQT